MGPAALLLGFASDRLLGDPGRLHPVAGLGQLACWLEARMWRPARRAGTVFLALLLLSVVVPVAFLDRRWRDNGARHTIFSAAVLWTVLGGRSLERAALAIAESVTIGDLDAGRSLAPVLVGRVPESLDQEGLLRAALESLAENTSDAVTASLLWAAVLGTPGAVAHRAVNTLDAIVGYRSERYFRFGWAAARLDDAANWPAARMTVALTAVSSPLVGGRPSQVLRAARREGAEHPSPNAGLVEAAFASALGRRLGGTTIYAAGVESRPLLGPDRQPRPVDIRRGVRLAKAVQVLALVVSVSLARKVQR
jgi:adenosylcobinamide-phosphate synthase